MTLQQRVDNRTLQNQIRMIDVSHQKSAEEVQNKDKKSTELKLKSVTPAIHLSNVPVVKNKLNSKD